jgi:sigma54-dependent transcription regulator
VTAERKKGGAAYRQRERSGGWPGEVREVLAVTSRGGSPAVMVGIGLSACAGGRARRRRVLQPAHGGIVQLNGTGSFYHTRFWKANRMRTLYVSGSETHIHSDYIIGHHHTMLKINRGKVLYYIKMSKTSIESNT